MASGSSWPAAATVRHYVGNSDHDVVADGAAVARRDDEGGRGAETALAVRRPWPAKVCSQFPSTGFNAADCAEVRPFSPVLASGAPVALAKDQCERNEVLHTLAVGNADALATLRLQASYFSLVSLGRAATS